MEESQAVEKHEEVHDNQRTEDKIEEKKEGEKAEGVISKSQQKKEIRKQKWLADKEKRKDRQKLKKQEKKEKRRLEKELNPDLQKPKKKPERDEDMKWPLPNKQIKLEYKRLVNEGQPIIIDCSFQDWLKEKELMSLCRQIGYCHSVNKKAAKPVKLIVTSYTDKLKAQLIKMGAENWGIHLVDKHYLDYYPKEKLVYLTGDTDKDIEEHLDKDSAYIIGGLVDHNRHKFATLKKATEEGLQVRRLPIAQNIKLKSSTILSVNHVFQIMVKVSNGEEWGSAINTSIPSRKREDTKKEEKKEESKKDDSEEDDEESDQSENGEENNGDKNGTSEDKSQNVEGKQEKEQMPIENTGEQGHNNLGDSKEEGN